MIEQQKSKGGSGGTTRPLPGDGGTAEGWGHGGTSRNSKSKGHVPKLKTDSVELLKELCFGLSTVLFAGDVSLKWSDRGGIIVKITLNVKESMKNVLRGSEPEPLKRKVWQWVTSTIFSFRLLFRPDQSQISSLYMVWLIIPTRCA